MLPNPSKKVTELLLKYLEFDPKQLHLGIWSGDLCIRDVDLRRESFYKLLNLHNEDDDDQLKMCLVQGSVGHLRMVVPWSTLLGSYYSYWTDSGDDVHVELSDVTLVLGFESRDATLARSADASGTSQRTSEKNKKDTVRTDEGAEYKDETRESRSNKQPAIDAETLRQKLNNRVAKQQRLSEAERLHLQGFLIPPPEYQEDNDRTNNTSNSENKASLQAGLIRRLMKSFASAFVWRFLGSLKVQLKNVQIVFIQDGVEMGMTLDHLQSGSHPKATVPVDGSKNKNATDKKQATFKDPEAASKQPPIPTVDVQESTPKRGSTSSQDVPVGPTALHDSMEKEPVNIRRSVQIKGCGIYIRNTLPNAKHSNSSKKQAKPYPAKDVHTTKLARPYLDDYVLQPIESTVSLYFARSDPKSSAVAKKGDPTPANINISAPSSVTSVPKSESDRSQQDVTGPISDSSSVSSTMTKRHRGKRDKRPLSRISSGETLSSTVHTSNTPQTIDDIHKALHTQSKGNDTSSNTHELGKSIATESLSGTSHVRRKSTLPDQLHDERLGLESLRIRQQIPKVSVHVEVGDIQTVCCTRHYQLVHTFLSDKEKMKNERPAVSILSCLSFGSKRDKMPVSPGHRANSSGLGRLSRPRRAISEPVPSPSNRTGSSQDERISQVSRNRPSLVDADRKSAVVRHWWKYAYSNVLREVQNRKKLAGGSCRKKFVFDCKKQTRLRKEYVDLYIALRLERRHIREDLDGKINFRIEADGEDNLLTMEDELCVEQVLLYRAIARSIKIEGFYRWGDYVASKQSSTPFVSSSRASRIPASRSSGIHRRNFTEASLGDFKKYSLSYTNRSPTTNDLGQGKRQKSDESNMSSFNLDDDDSDVRRKMLSRSIALDVPPSFRDPPNRMGSEMPQRRSLIRSPRSVPSGLMSDPSSGSSQISTIKETRKQPKRRHSRKISAPLMHLVTESDTSTVIFNDAYSESVEQSDTLSRHRSIRTPPITELKSIRETATYEGDGEGSNAASASGSLASTYRSDGTNCEKAAVEGAFDYSFSFSLGGVICVIGSETRHTHHQQMSHRRKGSLLSSDEPGIPPIPHIRLNQGTQHGQLTQNQDDVSVLTGQSDEDNEPVGEASSHGLSSVQIQDYARHAACSIHGCTDGKLSVFSIPHDVLCCIHLSHVSASMYGNSKKQQHTRFSVTSLNIVGDKSCRLLSSGVSLSLESLPWVNSATLSNDSEEAFPKILHDISCLSECSIPEPYFVPSPFLSMDAVIDHGAQDAATTKHRKAKASCDVSEIITNVEFTSIERVIGFLSEKGTMYPIPFILSPPQQINEDVGDLKTSASVLDYRMSNFDGRLSLHGFKLSIPIEIASPDSGSQQSALKSAFDTKAICICFDLFEARVGVLPNIPSEQSNEKEAGQSRDNHEQESAGLVDDSLLSSFHFSLHDCDVHIEEYLEGGTSYMQNIMNEAHRLGTRDKNKTCKLTSFLDHPVNAELDLSFDVDDVASDKNQASARIVLRISPLCIVVSKHMLNYVSICLDTFSRLRSAARDKHQILQTNKSGSPNGYQALLTVAYIESVDIVLEMIKIVCVADRDVTQIGMQPQSKELILEEILTDYISHLSCFNLKDESQLALSYSFEICVNRLKVLGFALSEAQECTKRARLNFLEDVKLMEETQQQVLFEISSQEEHVEGLGQRRHTISECPEFSDHGGSSKLENPRTGETYETESDEALDIIEETARNAVEKTIASFLSVLEREINRSRRSMSEVLIVELLSGISMHYSKAPYDVQIIVESVFIRNGTGVRLLELSPSRTIPSVEAVFHKTSSVKNNPVRNDRKRAGQVGEAAKSNTKVLPSSNDKESKPINNHKPGLIISHTWRNDENERNTEQSHAMGASESIQMNHELLHTISIADLNLTFCQTVVSQAVDEVSNLLSAICEQDLGSIEVKSRDKLPDHQAHRALTVGRVDTCTILLLSDDLAPFTACILHQVHFEKCTKSAEENILSSPCSETNLTSDSIELHNLTPEGQHFSQLMTHLPGDRTHPFVLKLTNHQDSWNQPSELSIVFTAVRLLVIRQYINELIQYTSSPLHGLGLLLSKFHRATVVDSSGNPKPPLHFHISIIESSLILPRNSESNDLVALESEKVNIFNSVHAQSWSAPQDSRDSESWVSGDGHHESTEASLPDKTLDRSWNGSVPEECVIGNPRSSMLGGDDSFHECMNSPDQVGQVHSHERTTPVATDIPVSCFDRHSIRRINIQAEGIRILSSMTENTFRPNAREASNMQRSGISFNGRAENQKNVYCVDDKDSETTGSTDSEELIWIRELQSRQWKSITKEGIELEVLVDYSPHLRILLRDEVITQHASDYIPPPWDLNVSLSQYCLLLSLWYENMQELPLMFPLSQDQIKAAATLPMVPSDWPEYGTEEFVDRLKNARGVTSFEMLLDFREVHIHSSYDKLDFFPQTTDGMLIMPHSDNQEGLTNELETTVKSCVVHLLNDREGLLRLGCGASTFEIHDHRQAKTIFSRSVGLASPPVDGADSKSNSHTFTSDPSQEVWADLAWGLDCGNNTLTQRLPLPFQLSLFLTPDRWCLLNLGADSADGVLSDLSPIWILLDFFGNYFRGRSFGHPFFLAQEQKEHLKFSKLRSVNSNAEIKEVTPEPMNLDVRLWFISPHIGIPQCALDETKARLIIESKGLFYRYKSIGLDWSSQEVSANELSLVIIDNCISNIPKRGLRGVSGSDSGVKTVIDGLCMALLYENNICSNHMNLSVDVPLNGLHRGSRDIDSTDLQVQPLLLPPPTICTPFVKPSRNLGLTVCDVTVNQEYIQLATSLLVNFLTGPVLDQDTEGHKGNILDPTIEENKSEAGDAQIDPTPQRTFSVAARLSGLRLFLSDPVLGMHLPVAVMCIPAIVFSASELSDVKVDSTNTEVASNDLQVAVDAHFWCDYFKLGVTRSWEPLVEPYKCLILYEKSSSRGQGVTFTAHNPFHFNVTGALLETLDEAASSFSTFWSNIFGSPSPETAIETNNTNHQRTDDLDLQSKNRATISSQEVVETMNGPLHVSHQIPPPLNDGERVAFSLFNVTGQRIRIHQQEGSTHPSSEEKTLVTYVNHLQSTKLSFAATMSVVRNLHVIEIPLERDMYRSNVFRSQKSSSAHHAVDVQLPGFEWIQGISVDTAGRQFESLSPRSKETQSKLRRDWRLKNALQILTEVGLDNGGRQLTLRSPFEVTNLTSHPISFIANPDAKQHPIFNADIVSDDESPGQGAKIAGMQVEYPESSDDNMEDYARIDPGEAYQIPTLLLLNALQSKGNQLGSFWIRPDHEQDEGHEILEDIRKHTGAASSAFAVGFCSRPVQLTKLVNESATMFYKAKGDSREVNRIRSGLQVACPIIHQDDGASVAPFCYVVETRRSPLVHPMTNSRERETQNSFDAVPLHIKEKSSSATSNNPRDTPDSLEIKTAEDRARIDASSVPKVTKSTRRGRRQDNRMKKGVHGPVAYSLFIHPPIVVENLLPESGRFELMHATRRSVVWWADLEPGESVPVHTVGLDSPLLLLINLGFCRTPVGEGALVHHGSGKEVFKKGSNTAHGSGWQDSIGKKVKKTFTAMSEPPGDRGKERVSRLQNTQGLAHDEQRDNQLTGADNEFVENNENDDDNNIMGDQFNFSAEDVATETTVVDSLGQRLVLRIDNALGGGGQRKISLFCPFWIVNTTEHSFRYKQDKGSTYVSGTVLSPARDGSRPVDGSNRNYVALHKIHQLNVRDSLNRGTVFPGTPGALATGLGTCNLSPIEIATLINKNLSFEKIVDFACMFNFQETASFSSHQHKLCVQLVDTTSRSRYNSGWSSGFSLDSVGVTQIVGMHCNDGRGLEVSVSISVAPGKLSKYTKIVRISPRYVLANQLGRPIRLWQDSSLMHSNYASSDDLHGGQNSYQAQPFRDMDEDGTWIINKYESLFGGTAGIVDGDSGMPPVTMAHASALYITTAATGQLVPFHLPDTRADRQLRIGFGSTWNLTSSFSSDITGECSLKITRSTDLSLFRHLSTRSKPQYKIVLPPPDEEDETLGDPWDGELGVWFETDWGRGGSIVVKGTKRGKYSFDNTDIHVGDELLFIDGESVCNMAFEQAMKLLKDRLEKVADYKRRHASTRQTQSITMSTRQKTIKPPKFFRRTVSGGSSQGVAQNLDDVKDEMRTLVLTFRTFEERMRRIRYKALKARRISTIVRGSSTSRDTRSNPNGSRADDVDDPVHTLSENQTSSFRKTEDKLKVELKVLHQSIFIFVRPFEIENPPYRIDNRAMNHSIYFRQRACDGHPWNCLPPGESMAYVWEEPMRPRKLTVRVGMVGSALDGVKTQDRERIIEDQVIVNSERPPTEDPSESTKKKLSHGMKFLSPNFVENEELGGFGPTRTVKLEEIGFKDTLPCPAKREQKVKSESWIDSLHCCVDSEGATRVLIVSDRIDRENHDETVAIARHLATLRKEIRVERSKQATFEELKKSLKLQMEESQQSSQSKVGAEFSNNEKGKMQSLNSGPLMPVLEHTSDDYSDNIPQENSPSEGVEPNASEDSVAKSQVIEREARNIADYPEDRSISQCNQVVIEVLECAGLKAVYLNGLSNPYCEVILKTRSQGKRNLFSKKAIKRKTYYVEKTLSPKWINQTFVFEVPSEAANVTRGHSIQVQLRNFGLLGKRAHLGQAEVHLRSLRNQRELVCWYPLRGRTGHQELQKSSAEGGRGSVKLRVQWIYSVPALLDYFAMISERRQGDLRKSMEGLEMQLKGIIESEIQKKEMGEPLSLMHIPTITALRGKQQKVKRAQPTYRGRVGALSPRDGDPVAASISTDSESLVLRGKWNIGIVGEHMRAARARYLHLLSFQTAESKRMRKNISVSDAIRGHEGLSTSPRAYGADPNTLLDTRQIPQNFVERDQTGSQSVASDLLDTDRCTGQNIEQVESDYSDRESILPNMYENEIGRSHSGNEFGAQSKDSPTVIYTVDTTDESHRADKIDALYREGMVYHESGCYFHQGRLTHGILQMMSVRPDRSCSQTFRIPFCSQKWSNRALFKSWVAAQVILNDKELKPLLNKQRNGSGENLLSAPYVDPSQIPNENTPSTHVPAVTALQLPPNAPNRLHIRCKAHAQTLMHSRRLFSQAAKRSLQSVLNPGGWLKIRPITALNLPDTYTGMFVKIRYGSVVLVSETADAKVTPTWAEEGDYRSGQTSSDPLDVNYRGRSHGATENVPHRGGLEEANVFTGESWLTSHKNDLHIHVEPLKTSGQIRLSVVGERLNSRVEIGVLQIPLAAALSCCSEYFDGNSAPTHLSGDAFSRMYVRWFPLMNPKDCVPAEGDMGLSTRPPEAEKEADNMFNNYFAPCIKLAFMWEPDAQDDYHESVSIKAPSLVAKTYVQAEIGSISAALIDSSRAVELLTLSTSDFDVHYSVTKAKTRLGIAVGRIQLDHQDDRSSESVVLAPTPVSHPQPTLQFLAIRDNLRSKRNIDSFAYIALALQELNLTIDEVWLFNLWEFFIGVLIRREAKKKKSKTKESELSSFGASFNMPSVSYGAFSTLASPSEDPNDLLLILGDADNASSALQAKKIYIEQLVLGFVKVNLSYVKKVKGNRDGIRVGQSGHESSDADRNNSVQISGPTTTQTSRQLAHSNGDVFRRWSEHTHDEDLWTEDGGKFSQNLPTIIATVFPAITDAPVRLQGKVIEHVFETASEIAGSLKSYYVNETLRQIYKIIGSVDFVGNPTMVFSSLWTGIRDFFVQPSKEFLKTKDPSRLGIGVLKGTLSLFSHSTSGIFGFASKMSATAGKAAATLSLDDEFRKRHAAQAIARAKMQDGKWARNDRKQLMLMVLQPTQDIVFGILGGATGILVEPCRGAKKGGTKGFVKGVAVGTIGIVAKPLVGIFDAFSHFSESVHDLAKSVNVLEKRFQPVRKYRLSYTFGLKKALLPFNSVDSRSITLLKRYPLDLLQKASTVKTFDESLVLAEVLSMEPGSEMYVVVTTARVLLFNLKKEGGGPVTSTLRWQLSLDENMRIRCTLEDRGHNGVTLSLLKHAHPRDRVVEYLDDVVDDASDVYFSDRIRDDQQLALVHRRNDSEGNLAPTVHVGSPLMVGDHIVNDELIPIPEPVPIRLDQQVNHPFMDAVNPMNAAKAIAQQAGAFRASMPHTQRATGGVASRKVERVFVHAEFHHRPKLERIHNAICCLTNDFDSIIHDTGIGTEGTSDGYTSFGQHTFDRGGGSDSLVEESKDYHVLYASLRNVPWFHESSGLSKEDKENDHASSSRRPQRLFVDELLASKKEGGPLWMIKARASATFVSPQMPALPPGVDPRDPLIIETLTSFEKGSITYDEACATIDEHVKLKVTARGDIARQDSEIEQSAIEKITENNDNEQNLVTRDSELRQLDSGIFHDSGSHTQHDLQDPVLIARLDRVENLLERLLAYEHRSLDRVSETPYPNETILSPDAPSEFFSDVTGTGSRHHGSLMDGVEVEAAQECNTSDISRLSGLANESELDLLRKEVDILRGQLRRKKDEKNSSKAKWFPSRKRPKS